VESHSRRVFRRLRRCKSRRASSPACLDAQHHPAGKARRDDLARARRSEKGSVAARDRRILEFPLSMSFNAVAKALIGEGWYSRKTKVYYIEFRVRRLRERHQCNERVLPDLWGSKEIKNHALRP
jgi:hypothetical protein